MNLADAIRKAALEATTSPAVSGVGESPKSSDRKPNFPEPPAVNNGNVVRLELFLNSEQVMSMLRALMAGQHTVLTLREAASYLRLTPSTLAELAEQGEVPGVLLEGRWRFPKTNLDEWLTMQSLNETAEEDKSVA